MPSAPNEPTTSTPRGHGRTVRIFLAVTAVMALLTTTAGAYAYVRYQELARVGIVKGFGPTNAPDPNDANAPVGPCINGVCNYLILGSDSRAGLTKAEQDQFGTNSDIGGESRSDTILLVQTDPSREKVAIVSFPRDLWVNIPGVGENKINAAFEGGVNGGGPELVAKTVHALTGLRINHFVYVDLAGFQGIVNTLAGVDMCIPGENVNTPGWVDGPDGPVYYKESGYIADPYTGLNVKPGCQRLQADQALAYVRTRHLPCDNIPDFARINRQQDFLRAVINRLVQPSELLKAPTLVRPILSSLKRDDKLNPVDLAYLVGQMRGIQSGAAEFRSVPGTVGTEQPSWSNIPLSVVHMEPQAEQLFRALRDGKPLPEVGLSPESVAPGASSIRALVVDHDSAGRAANVATVLSQGGFDITPGTIDYASFGSSVKGSVILYAPGQLLQAQVTAGYFPGLKLVEAEHGVLTDADVAVFVTAGYTPQEPASEPSAPACIVP